MQKKKVIKRKFKWKTFFKFCLFVGILFLFFTYLWNLKTQNIFIEGNTFVKDNDIITTSGFKDYPYLFRLKTKDIEKKVLTIPYIKSVKIKKGILGSITFVITEDKPLFYNRNNDKVVLSSGREIEDTLKGIPILINYVPDVYYTKLIQKLSDIDENVLTLISEIEYSPWTSNNVLIDEERFLLRMNDTNIVYTNLLHIDKLNKYIEIYATLEDKKGIIYLDSSSDKISFSSY